MIFTIFFKSQVFTLLEKKNPWSSKRKTRKLRFIDKIGIDHYVICTAAFKQFRF